MKTALVLAAALLSSAASAQPGVTPPTAPLPDEPAPGPTEATPSEPAPPPKADPAYGQAGDQPAVTGRTIVVRYTPSRSRSNITKVSLLAGSSVLFGAIGLYFHFDSRTLSDEVKALKFTGRPWTQERQDTYDDAHRSATIATVMYGIGGALMVTTAIYYIVTEPGQETMEVTPHANPKPTAMITPTRGGALVGAGWQF